MAYIIRKINNGIVIETPTASDGRREEFAFLFDDVDWKDNAIQYVNDKKAQIAQTYADRAISRINTIDEEE